MQLVSFCVNRGWKIFEKYHRIVHYIAMETPVLSELRSQIFHLFYKLISFILHGILKNIFRVSLNIFQFAL